MFNEKHEATFLLCKENASNNYKSIFSRSLSFPGWRGRGGGGALLNILWGY